MEFVDFKAGANLYRIQAATNELPNRMTLTNPNEFQAFATRENIIANSMPQMNWLEFGGVFIWGISDDDITSIREFLEV